MNSEINIISLSSEPHLAGPNAVLAITMRSELNAISGAVEWLMAMIQECHCVPGQERDVEIALREALANAVLHGNHQDAEKKIQISCRIQCGGEVSIIVRDEGKGFDPAKVPDPTAIDNIESEHGRGIYLMRALMDEIRFEQGGTELHMRKSGSHSNPDRRAGGASFVAGNSNQEKA
jgi:serine/threonine-protein kinase RsbW